jgi:hypothetical protein
MVGMACNGPATQLIKLILKNHHLTEVQLAKFSNDLNSLQTPCPSALIINQSFLFQRLQNLTNKKWHAFFTFTEKAFEKNFSNIIMPPFDKQSNEYEMLRIILPLTFDMNIAGKRLTKLIKDAGFNGNKHLVSNPVLRRQYAERWEESIKEVSNTISIQKQWYRIPLIRTRSELVTECIFVYLSLAVKSAINAFDRYDAQKEMTQIAIALERYKLAHGKYPEKLEALVPKYLDIVPIDPATGRTTFVYKLRDTKLETKPDPKPAKPFREMAIQIELPYILYSLGPNNKDDGGTTFFDRDNDNEGYDFVF